MAHNRGPRRRLAWVGLIEPLYHRHLSSCKHSSREREPGCYRHCYVILIPIISLFLFLFRPAASLTSDSTKSVIFGLFFSRHLLDSCELARLSCRMKCRTRWHPRGVFVIEGLAWDFGPANAARRRYSGFHLQTIPSVRIHNRLFIQIRTRSDFSVAKRSSDRSINPPRISALGRAFTWRVIRASTSPDHLHFPH